MFSCLPHSLPCTPQCHHFEDVYFWGATFRLGTAGLGLQTQGRVAPLLRNGAKLLVSSGGPTNCFRLLSTTCTWTSLMSSYSLQWNALSSTNTWLLHNPVSPDKRKISGRKPLRTQVYGQDTKILIFKPRQTSYSKCAVQGKKGI